MSNLETSGAQDAVSSPPSPVAARASHDAHKASATAAPKADAKPAAARKGSGKKKVIGAGLLLVALGVGGYVAYQSYFYVSTDNAMIQAQTTLLSSKVSGIIVKANVQENQKVKAGQVLVEIKPDDFKNAVDQLESDLESLKAQVHGAEVDYRRTLKLFRSGASTQERLDATQTQYNSLSRKLEAAEAQVAQAKLNLGYTQVVAPADGQVGRKSFEVGMLAAAGQPLLGFVAGKERWVVANLKETDMNLVTEGRKASVDVDALPGREFEGEVESISPTTGATFSLLPPDNATGNFTKVVQRVPVRIKLVNLSDKDIDRLQAGLSAEVKIRVR